MLSADVQITTEHAVFFWKPPTVFTQWSPSRVVIVGVSDVCAEQYMMAEKARTFGDEEGRRRILSTD